MFNRPDPPTGIFTHGVVVAEQIYVQAMELGLRIPQDLSVIAFGPRPPIQATGSLRERIAAVTADEVQLGRQAVELLDEMRAGRQPLESGRQIMMPLGLFAGQSLAAPPESLTGATRASAQEDDAQQTDSDWRGDQDEVSSLRD